MQKYKKISITKDQIRPTAQKMRDAGVTLAMIHAFFEDDGKFNISYEYETEGGIDSYFVSDTGTLPSISDIYDLGAEWPEREINELMGLEFEGLDTSKRLFLPETMIEGQGQILVTPMDQLIKKAHGKEDKA